MHGIRTKTAANNLYNLTSKVLMAAEYSSLLRCYIISAGQRLECLTLRKETQCSFQISVTIYQLTWCKTQEDLNLQPATKCGFKELYSECSMEQLITYPILMSWKRLLSSAFCLFRTSRSWNARAKRCVMWESDSGDDGTQNTGDAANNTNTNNQIRNNTNSARPQLTCRTNFMTSYHCKINKYS